MSLRNKTKNEENNDRIKAAQEELDAAREEGVQARQEGKYEFFSTLVGTIWADTYEEAIAKSGDLAVNVTRV